MEVPGRSELSVRLRHLEVNRFRGIRHLDCKPLGRVLALVGPGDSTKTTILDAVGLLASSRFGTTFTDTDFFAGDATAAFRVEDEQLSLRINRSARAAGPLPFLFLATSLDQRAFRSWRG
jgi:predicted ATP-dependent endonuclease of OLD family